MGVKSRHGIGTSCAVVQMPPFGVAAAPCLLFFCDEVAVKFYTVHVVQTFLAREILFVAYGSLPACFGTTLQATFPSESGESAVFIATGKAGFIRRCDIGRQRGLRGAPFGGASQGEKCCKAK
jgi:hypothetical protein